MASDDPLEPALLRLLGDAFVFIRAALTHDAQNQDLNPEFAHKLAHLLHNVPFRMATALEESRSLEVIAEDLRTLAEEPESSLGPWLSAALDRYIPKSS